MPAVLRPIALSLALCALAGCASAPRRNAGPIGESRVYRSSSAERVVFRAIGLVGTPYRYGGNTPESGFDCSGLVTFVYADAAGMVLPHSTGDLSHAGSAEAEPASGDVVLFAEDGDANEPSHAGIYVGGGRFVHAPKTGGTVRLDDLNQPYWHDRYLGARRLLD